MQSLRDLLLRHPFGPASGAPEAASVQHATDTGNLHRPPAAPTPPTQAVPGSADPGAMPSSPAQVGSRSPMVQYLYEHGIADLNGSAQGQPKVRRKDPEGRDPEGRDPEDVEADPSDDLGNAALLAALLAGKAGIVAGSLGAFNGAPAPAPATAAVSGGIPASPLLS